MKRLVLPLAILFSSAAFAQEKPKKFQNETSVEKSEGIKAVVELDYQETSVELDEESEKHLNKQIRILQRKQSQQKYNNNQTRENIQAAPSEGIRKQD
ncbi:MAG: hypothetical protein LAT54_00565 [Cryomorphaceae bacterium]|nr:hypothetical protein [Cryomorphaceae bacterium]